MKRLLMILIPFITLCSCSGVNNEPIASSDVVETEKNKRYEIDLNLDNYWKYFEESGNTNASGYNSLTFSIKGVLSYAYYEDVYISFYVKVNDVVYPKLSQSIELRADGYGTITPITYDTVFMKNAYGQDVSLYSYQRSIYVKSISGKVIFSI